MMQVVWKFPINTSKSRFTIEMPRYAKVLTCMMQQGVPCMWALVFPEQEKVTRTFCVVGTGHNFDSSSAEYIGTFQIDGYFMFHLFEIKEYTLG